MNKYKFNFENSYLVLEKSLYTRLEPIPVALPKLVIFNQDLSDELGLDFYSVTEKEIASLFSGNRILEGAQPLSQAYAGHQFGHLTILGDGRAHLLGEHITKKHERFDIQLKGSGPTPYSRRGDGRAALAPMLREYIISEAMNALGIPTSRSLAVVTTGENVYRETALQGAILTRVAASHIRVGTFVFAAMQKNRKVLESLLNYTVKRHYPSIDTNQNKALKFLYAVIERQVELMVEWARVGFIHGVMNTDNMALSGETIDYGPCAYLDEYDSNTVFSSIDKFGRYSFGNQPKIAQWNIARLAEALLSLIDLEKSKAISLAEKAVNSFSSLYEDRWLSMMRAKLGLVKPKNDDKKLIRELLTWMQRTGADYTNTFCDLRDKKKLNDISKYDKEFEDWTIRWQLRVSNNPETYKCCIDLMKKTNPEIIPRNHIVETVLDAAEQGDLQSLHKLLDVLKNPYRKTLEISEYKTPPKDDQRIFQTFCGT